ncbi:hypothetical protein KAFR_0H02120 [Kazachstania africana CBS 2517]|uniref:PABS domain-containing protein n=1 Tax=Kazachstania africana (strain ATCC 22294 / BCRC 22015 / CBS 2517 / CECT 1963 / NBRC 1671 / NRRL Y-8276) TaxID=1071382 RepID=H2AZ65_KAZAF|nr:hypothetical protein KAFR_0H02120 [Kazachstania africana CBS 2517]CCF59621.1 hypothetical protein KAFR_0H02120 [Kazachstania africana CBS 2517]
MSHPSIVDGWFREINDKSFPGQAFSLRVDKLLYQFKSEFQDILVFHNDVYGNVLVLDGIIQCTEKDEFAYQEMITHIPLYLHSNPKKVLVIGGGDGGVIREVLKHDCVESVTLVEIDETVIQLSKKYLPNMSCGFTNEKLTIKLVDGFQFLKDLRNQDKFDVIITDSSDPEGPAEAFFQRQYFQLLKNALSNDNGIIISQTSENIWLNVNYLQRLTETAREVFTNVKYCSTMVPSYTSGQLGLLVCTMNDQIDLTEPTRFPTTSEQSELRYYNKDIHSASFVLPKWVENDLN